MGGSESAGADGERWFGEGIKNRPGCTSLKRRRGGTGRIHEMSVTNGGKSTLNACTEFATAN